MNFGNLKTPLVLPASCNMRGDWSTLSLSVTLTDTKEPVEALESIQFQLASFEEIFKLKPSLQAIM